MAASAPRRIARLEVLHRAFARPADYSIQGERQLSPRELTVQALFDVDVARWVQEERLFYIETMVMQPDGLLVTLRVRREEEVLQWLLGWGAHVRVLEPAMLREQMVAEAQRMIERYKMSD